MLLITGFRVLGASVAANNGCLYKIVIYLSLRGSDKLYTKQK